jgi:hypothetical protein
MALYRPPSLDKNAPIVNPVDGRITPYFQRFWQNLSFTAAEGASAAPDVTNKVTKLTSTGWTVPTGSGLKSGFTVYMAPTISASPTQAEVQAMANALQDVSRTVKALVEAGLGSQLLGN